MIATNRILAIQRRGYRDLEPLDKRDQFIRGAGNAYAPARYEDRTFRRKYRFQRRRDTFRIGWSSNAGKPYRKPGDM